MVIIDGIMKTSLLLLSVLVDQMLDDFLLFSSVFSALIVDNVG